MAFSTQVKQQIYQRAGGACECTRIICNHIGRCARRFTQYNTLTALLIAPSAYPGFEFNHVQSQVAGGADTAINGEFLCISCHQNTRTYGTNLTR